MDTKPSLLTKRNNSIGKSNLSMVDNKKNKKKIRIFFPSENSIKIDEGKLKGYGETMTFEILHLTKDTLSMRFVDYGDTSFVLLVPAK